MKKMMWIAMTAIAMYSCSNESEKTTDVTKDSTAAEPAASTVSYPYTIEHPDYWETGSNENTKAALSALKAFENGNVDESMKYFGDSVQVQFDGLDKTMSNDSLKAMFTSTRSAMKSLEVRMDDWESVISKDKAKEWVTLWYRQRWEDQKGTKDSADIMNDLQLKNGKIVRLDEYTRKLH